MSNGGPRRHTGRPAGPSQNLDFSTPNVARIYDYYLGGKDNYACDREAARAVLAIAPDIPLAALENREFLNRAIRFLAAEGVTQFIDIGPGLPTQGNSHQLAQGLNPQARIVYIDNDPVVLTHGRALLHRSAGVSIIGGDLRQPEAILADPGLLGLIDLAQPVALCLSLVLQFIPDTDDPYGVVARLRDALCAGSWLVVTHVTGDDRDPATMGSITSIYDEATAPLVPRTHAQVSRFFDGFELAEPGLVFLSQWQPATEQFARGGRRWAYAGAGRKATGSRP